MNTLESSLNSSVELRNAFDRIYATPNLDVRSSQTDDLVAIRTDGHPYAIRLSEITGLFNDRQTVVLPSPIPEMLGLSNIRGAVVPIYSLAAMLGHSIESTPGRWIVLCGTDDPVGLGFATFESYLRVPSGQIHTAGKESVRRDFVKDVVRTGDAVRPIVSIPSVLEAIRKRYGQNRLAKKAAV